jgi:Arc/MetJ-type ribon-helix-helix transcriptional regulator
MAMQTGDLDSMVGKINLFYANVNEKGKSVTVATRITPETSVVIERMIESGRSPWRSKSEFIRDAISNFVEEYAERQEEVLPQVLSVIRKLQERSFRNEVLKRVLETVISSEEEIALYVKTGEHERLFEELGDICDIILSLRDDPFWFKLTIISYLQNEVISNAFSLAMMEGVKGSIEEVVRVFREIQEG